MRKEEYVSPKAKTIEVDLMQVIAGSNNGKHHGWDNPNNPHYPGDDEDDDI